MSKSAEALRKEAQEVLEKMDWQDWKLWKQEYAEVGNRISDADTVEEMEEMFIEEYIDCNQ